MVMEWYHQKEVSSVFEFSLIGGNLFAGMTNEYCNTLLRIFGVGMAY